MHVYKKEKTMNVFSADIYLALFQVLLERRISIG